MQVPDNGSGSEYATATRAVAGARDTVFEIWHHNLGGSRQAGKFDWFYRGCPDGEPLLQLLYHRPSACWVGTCAAGPRRMMRQGEAIRAGVLVDMAVAEAHRTLGPALIMQAALLEAARGRFDFLYGFPNRKSLPVMKRMGYLVLGQLPRYSCVLRHAHYLERYVPRWLAAPGGWLLDRLKVIGRGLHALRSPRLHGDWVEQVDERMDTLWNASADTNSLMTPREAAFLRWRFDPLSGATIRYLLLAARPDGPLRAWFACQVVGPNLYVRDFWSDDAARGVGMPYLMALLRHAYKADHDAVAVEYAAVPDKLHNWIQAGFVERERRPIVGKWLHGEPAGEAPFGDWHFTAADEDE